MKKFSKILLLLLSLVAIITAFTVAALAAEETERTAPQSFYSYYNSKGTLVTNVGGNPDTTYTKYDSNQVWAYAATTRGVIYVDATPDGNKFLSAKYVPLASGTKTNGANTDIHATYSRWDYSIDTHPVMSIDFDIMSYTGKFGDTSSNCTSLSLFTNYLNSSGKASSGPSMNSIKLCNLGLENVAYKWQHVTLIYTYDSQAMTFTPTVYINGVKSETAKLTATDLSANTTWKGFATLENVHMGQFRITAQRFSDSTYESHVGFDNFRFNYFPIEKSGEFLYSNDEIATYVYNDSYTMPASMKTAGGVVTDASGNSTYYETPNAALAAAVAGDTVTLMRDYEGIAVIDKAITVKTAMVNSANVVAEKYDFTYATKDGYLATADAPTGTTLTFAQSTDYYNVNWDPECEGDCTCDDEVKHLFTYSTTVALNAAPLCPFSTEIGFKNGCLIDFLGWTTVKGGTEEDIVDLSTVTATEPGATVNLYPVYDITRYDIEVIKNGVSTGYMASEYLTAIAAVAKGGTIKLHADLETESVYTFTTSSVNIVFDLNGYDFKRFSIYNHHYNATWDDANGVWVKGSRMTKTVENSNGGTSTVKVGSGSAVASAFVINADDLTFTIKNSGDSANIYTYTQFRDTWYDSEGNLVGYDSVRDTETATGNSNSGTILFGYKGAKRTTIDIQGENITYYGACLVLNEWGGNQNTNTVKINGGTYYSVVNTYTAMISQLAGGTVDVQNATFVTNGYSAVIRVAAKVNTSAVTVVDFKFTNCDIIGGSTQNANDIGAAGIVLKNCRYYATGTSANDLTLDRGTISNEYAYTTPVSDGMDNVSYKFDKTYTLVKETTFVLGENDLPTFVFTPVEKTYSFVYRVVNPATDYTSVTWKSEDGYVFKTTKELKNEIASAPNYAISSGDKWRGYAVTEWLDAEGNVSNLALGDASEYTFTAKAPVINESTPFVSCITDAQFNFIYYGQFHTLFYLPVTEDMEAPTVDGFNSEYHIVKIDGEDYWTYTKYNSTATVSDNFTAKVNFKLDGVDYTQTFNLSALIYADMILTTTKIDVEKTAVANMVRYVKEARLASRLEVSDKFDELIALGNLSDLGTKEDYVDTSVDYSTLSAYIQSIHFMIEGSSAAYVIKLTDSAVAAEATISVAFADSNAAIELRNSTATENTKYTTNTRVYDLVNAIKITVTVPAAEGEPTVITGTYSVKAYINATDNALAKAMYEFGVAAKAYRKYLETL